MQDRAGVLEDLNKRLKVLIAQVRTAPLEAAHVCSRWGGGQDAVVEVLNEVPYDQIGGKCGGAVPAYLPQGQVAAMLSPMPLCHVHMCAHV